MPEGAVELKPGVVAEFTPTLNSAGYSSSNLGRFRAGLFEKIGGWTAYYQFTIGTARVLKAWQDFNAIKWLATGSTSSVNVIPTTGSAQNITPQTYTSSFAPNFTTTASSTTVTITDSNIANVTTLDSIEFLTPISIDGIILSGVYPIASVTGTTSYRITAASAATAGVTGGGAVPLFTTTNASSTVSVAFANHGLAVASQVVFPIATSVGGLSIIGTYPVVGITNADTFTISASSAATSGATVSMNSGNADLKYYIALGPASANGTGWGVLGWGVVPWGGTGALPSSQTGTNITATDYTMDNWGQTFLACPAYDSSHTSGVYQWTPGSGYSNLQLLAAAPAYASGILVSTPAQILIAYGAAVNKDIGIAQDPLTYAWSDQLDYTFWTPTVINPTTGIQSQAGSNRIPTGSAIKAGLAVAQKTLLWTDLDVWSIDYVGPPYVFGQTKIGGNCGTISRHSVAEMGGVAYWWGRNNFYRLAGGAPEVIPCSVWDVVFQDIDTSNLDKCWIETVTSFNEIFFFYPSSSGGTGQCDSYAKFNVVDNVWDYGSLPRAAGIDQSVLGNPIMATPGGVLYQHETGYNADGQALMPSFTTGYFYLGNGEDFVFVDEILPDFKWGPFNGSQTATVNITFNVINFMGDTPRTYGPYAMTNQTNKLNVRIRGRQASMTISSNDLNSSWRIGKIRYRFAADGRLG